MKILTLLLDLLLILNIFDILLHLFINQPELLRITGNIVVICVAATLIYSKKQNYLLLGGVINLILNLIFVFFNPIGGMGVLLISITTLLSFYIGNKNAVW